MLHNHVYAQEQLPLLLDQVRATMILRYTLIISKASTLLFVLPKFPSWISGLHQQLKKSSD